MNGFSLLELIVVLAIVAAVSAVAAPHLSGAVRAASLTAGARELAASLRAARSEAVVQRREVAFVPRRDPRLAADAPAIRFFPDGSSSGGRLTLRADGRSAHVEVDWLTGRVSIHE